eukprot:jgi/Astpho2/2870/e_gw1.00050.168.1_t
MSSRTPDLSREQLDKAVVALLKYVGHQQEESNNLLDEDDYIHLTVALAKTPTGPRKDKPVRIALPNPIYTFDGAEVCLFVKDHKGQQHYKAAKKRVRQEKIAGVSKVIGISKLRTKYEPFEAKRTLCNSFDLFVADDRIIPSLPKLLGKHFFKKKKSPIPVDLTSKDWAAQIGKAVSGTYLRKGLGSTLSIRAARTSMTPEQCVENVLTVVTKLVEHIPKRWSNVQALHLKTSDSAALPIYQRAPAMQVQIGAHQQ